LHVLHAFALKAWICSGAPDRCWGIGWENFIEVPSRAGRDACERGGWKMKMTIVAATDSDGQAKEGRLQDVAHLNTGRTRITWVWPTYRTLK